MEALGTVGLALLGVVGGFIVVVVLIAALPYLIGIAAIIGGIILAVAGIGENSVGMILGGIIVSLLGSGLTAVGWDIFN